MELVAIDIEGPKNEKFRSTADCIPILDIYSDYYKKIGFVKPWIGYFVLDENDQYVGVGGFKGAPKDAKIEIAYGTFTSFQGQGIATEICRCLVNMALNADPTIKITARTLPENNFSTRILKKNGFVFVGPVVDEDDGNVWEWEFPKVGS